MTRAVNLAVEGFTDEIVMRSILKYVDLEVSLLRKANGKPQLLQNLPKYNQAAKLSNWVVVLDLDQEACAVTYVKSLLPESAPGMILRIAVREIEAWLLADRERIAAFLNIAVKNVPLNPDLEADPKETLINLARRCRKTALREDIVPRLNSGIKIGPGYPGRMNEFVTKPEHHWRPEVAAEHSDSLKRCIRALKNWKRIDEDS